MNSTDTTLGLLHSRRSVVAADMTDPGPNDEQLQQILAAGIRVPDHGRICPWRIQIIGSEGRERLVELHSRLFSRANPAGRPKQLELLNRITLRVPRLLVVSSHPDPGKFDTVPLVEQQMSAGAVCQNILVATHALGYVGQWLTGWRAYQPEIKALFGLDTSVGIAAFLHLGSPRGPVKERDRPLYSRIVSTWNGD